MSELFNLLSYIFASKAASIKIGKLYELLKKCSIKFVISFIKQISISLLKAMQDLNHKKLGSTILKVAWHCLQLWT